MCQEVFLALGIEHTNNERWNQDKKCINGRCQREKLAEVNWKYKTRYTRQEDLWRSDIGGNLFIHYFILHICSKEN